ncbi:glycoside hydrolase superfamily [Phyllosticta citriasiana]|uniref:glucan 1,3-beta-glucosidase n=2 Tax=Phyllosticta citriasiana TaxID=595635 RepID=A0ABR1KP94_9PEZI
MPRDSNQSHSPRHRAPDSSRERDARQRRRRSSRPHDTNDRERDYVYESDAPHRGEGQRRRRGHRATDSSGNHLPPVAPIRPPPTYDSPYHSSSPSPTKDRRRHRHRSGTDTPASRDSGASGRPLLSGDALAQLDQLNARGGWKAAAYDDNYLKEVREREAALEKDRLREEKEAARREKEDRRQRRREREEARLEREKRKQYERDMGFAAAAADDGIRVRGDDDIRVVADDGEVFEPYTDDPYATDSKEERRRRRREYSEEERDDRRRRRKERALATGAAPKGQGSRIISGTHLEKGSKEYQYRTHHRGGGGGSGDGSSDGYDEKFPRESFWSKIKRKKWLVITGIVILLLVIIIPVAIVVGGNKKSNDGSSDSSSSTQSSKPDNSNLNGISEDDIPKWAQGGLLDPFDWYDTVDFNVTFTNNTVGGLSIMGLNDTWDDTVRANDRVPALDGEFKYGEMPIRGVNVGGWLNIEPFITPSFFESYKTSDGVIDEWTLCTSMGASKCKTNLEEHYSSWITKQTFIDIRNAGFDHVRIPFNYWAVTTYDGDPYVPKIAWRYLLRGIEYARQQGLRVNLDLHGLPGSQNGWNHSGRQGAIGWLNGTDGTLNGQRSIDIHNQLSQFFAQPRYKNIITLYGLVNEPRMVELNTQDVLDWYDKVIPTIRGNKYTGILVFGDGFLGLDNWQGKLQNYDNLLLDVHQYVIFNVDQIVLSHAEKLQFACKGWTQQSLRSMDKTTGFGPTMCGEWSQADTDCTQYINNVGWGTRWEGTYNTGNSSTSVLSPTCPSNNNPRCDCDPANADPSEYSDVYKSWLMDFALAQMYSFEQGWGWFYWTWKTEKATQWSYEAGMKAGILPQKAWDRSAFQCNTSSIPDFAKQGLPEHY